MSEKSDHQAIEAAFQAALAARQETILAHCPRKLKLGVTFLLFVLLTLPFWPQASSPAPEPESPPALSHADKAEEFPHELKPEAIVQTLAGHSATRRNECHEPRTDIEKQGAARNDSDEEDLRLSSAPDAGLIEETTGGYLPRVGRDGRKPWQVYARPFDRSDPRPRIAIVVGDLGLSRIATDAALRRLPPDVTLAFDSQGESVNAWLERARQDGHETLLSLPMEPLDYPRSDPGPNALLTTLPNSDNLQRFLSILKRGVGYVGITTMTGSRFAADSAKIMPIMEDLRSRGLLVLDPDIATHSVIRSLATELRVPVAVSSRVIDANPTPHSIDEALAQLEQMARVEGQVVAVASPLPVTLERIEAWAKQLSAHGVVLAPISAVVE